MGGAGLRKRELRPARRQFPSSLNRSPEHTRVVMEVGAWVSCWDGGSTLGPVRRQFPSVDHTAPRAVGLSTGTTTTPATTSTKSLSTIGRHAKKIRMQ